MSKTLPMDPDKNTIPVSLVNEMKTAYGDYALAVLIGRAIPDLYDGLKPVTRRILTAMKWLNLKPDGRFMKCARIDGETTGKLSPHGSAYGALITVAQDFNNNHKLINVHGNSGSPTDNAAASRYTEAKVSEFAWDVLLDDFDVCDTRPNYDGTLQEPIRLETKVPTVLLNGVEGIGVGFATKIAPHNLRDVCKAVEWVAKGNKKKAAECLIPDFPTNCDIVKDDRLREYLVSGAGSMRLRAKVQEGVEKRGRQDRVTLTFTQLPFQTNTESIGQQIKKGLEQGKIDGVTEVRDESDRDGDRLVIQLKNKVSAKDVLPYLFAYTDLSTTFSAKSLFIDGSKPVELAPYQVVEKWFAHRQTRLVVKFDRERGKKADRVHIVDGLLKAIDKLDLTISIIRKAKDKAEAKAKLMTNRSLKLSAEQAEAVLEMRLRQLTNLDTTDLESEKAELEKRIAVLVDLIENEESRTKYIITEVKDISKKYGNERRSEVIEYEEEQVTKTTAKTISGPRVPKTRCIKVDMKKGVVEQLKGPRGATIVTQTDKVVFAGENGIIRKLPPTFKGPLFEGPTPVVLKGTETEIESRKYLVVFELDDALKAIVLDGADLVKTTSRGKAFVPENSSLKFMGEGNYTLTFKSARKKNVILNLANVKAGKPRGKGIKVAKLTDLSN